MPSFHLSLSPNGCTVGAGYLQMPPEILARFRAALDNRETAAPILKISDDLRSSGARLNDTDLKRVPPGFDAHHPHADLLRRKGLSAWIDRDISMHEDVAVAILLGDYQVLTPLVLWLSTLQ